MLNQNELSENNAFSIRYCHQENDIFIINGSEQIGIREIYRNLKNRYKSRFRGAIVYSEEIFRGNLRLTRETMQKYFGDNYRVAWAVKSAPVKKLVEIASEESVSFDVGSYEELCLAKTFASGDRIYHTAPGKFDWDIEAIAQSRCVSISDNITELSLLNEKAKSLNTMLTVGLRINPTIDGSTQSEISTGTLDCKFGIPEVSEDFVRSISKLVNLKFRILHMHIGSQIADPQDYENALTSLFGIYRYLQSHGIEIDTIDIGGGFPYPYHHEIPPEAGQQTETHSFHNYIPYSFESYISRIHDVLKNELGRSIPHITIEPGRHIAAGAAFALGYVLSSKYYPNDMQWLISSISVNDIFHKMLIPDTCFDIQVIGDNQSHRAPTAIGGTLCFSGDILTPKGKSIRLGSTIDRNDILLFRNVGAYSISGSGNFHNMPRLPILMVDSKSNLIEIRGEEKPYFE